MNELFQFISSALAEPVADLVDMLFRLAFWQLLAGVVILTLSVALVSSLSDIPGTRQDHPVGACLRGGASGFSFIAHSIPSKFTPA